ncbi:unnamed protein product [Prunus brigantina]
MQKTSRFLSKLWTAATTATFPDHSRRRNRRSWLENAENQPVFVETLDRSFSLDSQPNRTNEVLLIPKVLTFFPTEDSPLLSKLTLPNRASTDL